MSKFIEYIEPPASKIGLESKSACSKKYFYIEESVSALTNGTATSGSIPIPANSVLEGGAFKIDAAFVQFTSYTLGVTGATSALATTSTTYTKDTKVVCPIAPVLVNGGAAAYFLVTGTDGGTPAGAFTYAIWGYTLTGF